MSKNIKYMKTHTPIFIPGLGDLGTTIPTSTKTIPVKMTDLDTAVLIEAKGFTIKIPYGNVSLMELSEEPAAPNLQVKAKK